MIMDDKHILTILGRYENIKQVCAFVANGAARAGLAEPDKFHVELACDEACTNIIEHAYGGEGIGNIVVHWAVEGNKFVITLYDNGRSFNPSNVANPPLPTSNKTQSKEELISNLKAGGLGIHFMRKLMDDVQYQFDPNLGNSLTMIKKIR